MFRNAMLSILSLALLSSVAQARSGKQVAIIAQDSGIDEVDGKLMAISNEKAIFSQYADRFNVDLPHQRGQMVDVNNPFLVPNGGLSADDPGNSTGLLFKWDPASADLEEFTCTIEPRTRFLSCSLGQNDQFAVCLDPQGEFLNSVYYLYMYPSAGPLPARCHTVNLKTELGSRRYDDY